MTPEDQVILNKVINERSVVRETESALRQIKNEIATLETAIKLFTAWGTDASEQTMMKCLGRIADVASKANYETYVILEGRNK